MGLKQTISSNMVLRGLAVSISNGHDYTSVGEAHKFVIFAFGVDSGIVMIIISI